MDGAVGSECYGGTCHHQRSKNHPVMLLRAQRYDIIAGIWLKQRRPSASPNGYGSKLNHQGTAGFSPCFHLPGFHFGYIFLTHSQIRKWHLLFQWGYLNSWLSPCVRRDRSREQRQAFQSKLPEPFSSSEVRDKHDFYKASQRGHTGLSFFEAWYLFVGFFAGKRRGKPQVWWFT